MRAIDKDEWNLQAVDSDGRTMFSKGLAKISGAESALSLGVFTLENSLEFCKSKQGLQSSSLAFQERLTGIVDSLKVEHKALQNSFYGERDTQGVVGRLFDGAKNYVGTDASRSDNTNPGWLWARLFNRSAGSIDTEDAIKKAEKDLDNLKQAAQNDDLVKFGSLYRGLTGKEFDQNKTVADSLSIKRNVNMYRASQANGVEFISDLGAAGATLGALRFSMGTRLTESFYLRLATGFLAGAGSKGLLKQVDGKYSNILADLISGGVVGLAFPLAQRSGLNFTGIPLKHGIGVIAGTENATRTLIHELREGERLDGYQLLTDAMTGYGMGYASATAVIAGLSRISRAPASPGALKAVKFSQLQG